MTGRRDRSTNITRPATRGFNVHDADLPARKRGGRNPALRGESSTLPGVGQRVTSTSGRPLGVVAQVRPDCFQMAMEDDDIWLTRDAIFTVEEQVTLICEPERISAYMVNPRRNGFR